MLQRAAAKSHAAQSALDWIEADALDLPFPSAHFDLVISAFGFRNLADYDAGLREIIRVLRPGGECGILDFGEPQGLLGSLYRIYFKQVLPRIGTIISGVSGPYAYLPASVERFPAPPQMIERMKAAGFAQASWTPYTFGIAGLIPREEIRVNPSLPRIAQQLAESLNVMSPDIAHHEIAQPILRPVFERERSDFSRSRQSCRGRAGIGEDEDGDFVLPKTINQVRPWHLREISNSSAEQ